MVPAFSQAEIDYLMAWAREDHLGLAAGPARSLLRQHGVHPAVMGQLFARLSTLSGKSQFDMVDGPGPQNSLVWPWSTASAFETRLHEVLPQSTVRYLEELGALKATAAGLSH